MKLRNLRPGAWEITPSDAPSFVVVDDHEFDIDDEDLARSLLAQPDNYEPVDADAKALLEDVQSEQDKVAEAAALADRIGGMKVTDVMPLLDVATVDELQAARAAETAGKARHTVLGRIDELLTATTAATGGEEV